LTSESRPSKTETPSASATPFRKKNVDVRVKERKPVK
jgi:hypothetical protein